MSVCIQCGSSIRKVNGWTGWKKFCDQECCNLHHAEQTPQHEQFAMTHAEIGIELGISKQAVAQIEKRALAKLARTCGNRRKWL